MKLLNDMFTVEDRQGADVRVRLDAAHPIYQAHFPGNPITPGVCLVQMVCELLQLQQGCRLSLRRIVNLKFVAPVSPVDSPLLTFSFASVTCESDVCKAKGTVVADGQVMTKFSIVFQVER